MTVADAKAQARTEAYARRKSAYTDAALAAAARSLAEVLEAHTGRPLSGYLPIRTEADPRAAMALAARSGTVGVPVVTGPGMPLTFLRWTPDVALVEGSFGVMVPRDAPPMTPEVLIVPMLAFDARGYRLGYGGGFYDRTLEALRRDRRVLAIGFAFAAQRLDRVPTESTDQPLDMIVTEAGVAVPD